MSIRFSSISKSGRRLFIRAREESSFEFFFTLSLSFSSDPSFWMTHSCRKLAKPRIKFIFFPNAWILRLEEMYLKVLGCKWRTASGSSGIWYLRRRKCYSGKCADDFFHGKKSYIDVALGFVVRLWCEPHTLHTHTQRETQRTKHINTYAKIFTHTHTRTHMDKHKYTYYTQSRTQKHMGYIHKHKPTHWHMYMCA